jgi:hypothetical protein
MQQGSFGDEFQRNLLNQWMDSYGEAGGGVPPGLIGEISRSVKWDILQAGAFGVALMQAVGQPSYAGKLQKVLFQSFKEYLAPQL